MRVLFIVFLALLIGACATTAGKVTPQLEKAWQGKSVTDLIAAKASPIRNWTTAGRPDLGLFSSESEPALNHRPRGLPLPAAARGGRGSGRHGGAPVGVVPPAAARQELPTLCTKGPDAARQSRAQEPDGAGDGDAGGIRGVGTEEGHLTLAGGGSTVNSKLGPI